MKTTVAQQLDRLRNLNDLMDDVTLYMYKMIEDMSHGSAREAAVFKTMLKLHFSEDCIFIVRRK